MATNVHLTPELERFARGLVASGRYNSVSEAVRAALRLLQAAETGETSAGVAEADKKFEDERPTRREIAIRKAVWKRRLEELEKRPIIDIGPWTRDELYDD